MKNTITSLTALQEEKKKLKMEIELSKREFTHSLGSSRANLKDFLVQKVAIPTGIAGVGIAGLNKLMSSSDNHSKASNTNSFLTTALPIVATIVQTYFFKNKTDENRN
jgi:hypothetical protein